MKTLVVLFGIAVAAIAVWLGACAITQNKPGTGGVVFEEEGVAIHAGTQISADDQREMNNILRHFDKSLYKIQTFENGKLVKTQGTLRDMFIDRTLLAEAAGKVEPRTPVRAVMTSQVLQTGFISQTRVKIAHPAKAKELANQLRPVLEKYSR